MYPNINHFAFNSVPVRISFCYDRTKHT